MPNNHNAERVHEVDKADCKNPKRNKNNNNKKNIIIIILSSNRQPHLLGCWLLKLISTSIYNISTSREQTKPWDNYMIYCKLELSEMRNLAFEWHSLSNWYGLTFELGFLRATAAAVIIPPLEVNPLYIRHKIISSCRSEKNDSFVMTDWILRTHHVVLRRPMRYM